MEHVVYEDPERSSVQAAKVFKRERVCVLSTGALLGSGPKFTPFDGA